MSPTPAPACKAALAEATKLWPRRNKASDGIMPSAAHTARNPRSDHELGNAVDLTHSPESGCDAHAQADRIRIRRDPRVKYVISRRRIAGPATDWEWRPYNGSNPHDSHAHISIFAAARDDCRPWFMPANLEDATVAINRPAVAIMPTRTGDGYFIVAADGGVFAYGSAQFRGSLGGSHINAPIVGAALTPSGNGYWLLGADGGVFNFGDAGFHGTPAG